MSVFCLLETDTGGIAEASLRALSVAGELAASARQDLAAAWFGDPSAVGTAGHADLSAAGVARGYAIGSAGLTGYAPFAWATALGGLTGLTSGAADSAVAVVAAATDHGNEVLAHLGAITGLPMAANCVSATWTEPAGFEITRQRWAGSLLEDALLDAPTALITVADDASTRTGRPAASPDPPDIAAYRPEPADGDLTVQAVTSAQGPGGVSLATARVVIGGGRGVGGPEGFAALEELAGLLGAAVGVSRVVTSQGWRPHNQQVGQTGTKITPDLYLACGISGAIQHMAGCAGARTIIAINTDADAPIIAKADYAVIGDLHQVVPAMVTLIAARTADPR